MGDTSQKILAVRGVKLELKQLDRVDLSSHPHGEIWNTFAGLFPDKIEACFPVSGINDASGGLGAFPVVFHFENWSKSNLLFNKRLRNLRFSKLKTSNLLADEHPKHKKT